MLPQWESSPPHMHENSTGTPCPLLCPCSIPPLRPLSTSEPEKGLDWGGATWPSTNNELGSARGCAKEISSGTNTLWLWFLLCSLFAALLSTARNWPRDGVLFVVLLTSILSLEQSENIHGLDLQGFLTLSGSGRLPLIDLLESSRMLETPIRLPNVILLSWKKDPVDCKKNYSMKLCNKCILSQIIYNAVQFHVMVGWWVNELLQHQKNSAHYTATLVRDRLSKRRPQNKKPTFLFFLICINWAI